MLVQNFIFILKNRSFCELLLSYLENLNYCCMSRFTNDLFSITNSSWCGFKIKPILLKSFYISLIVIFSMALPFGLKDRHKSNIHILKSNQFFIIRIEKSIVFWRRSNSLTIHNIFHNQMFALPIVKWKIKTASRRLIFFNIFN